MKQYILIGVSVLAGMLAFLIAHIKIQGDILAEKQALKQTSVVVVRGNMIAGQVITESDLGQKAVYQADLTKREIPYNASDLAEAFSVVGRQLRVDVPANSPLLWTYIDMPSSGTTKFANSINKTQQERAITINVDNSTGVGGLLRPNDHVDLLGTFRFPAENKGNLPDTVTLTVLQNVTLLAVGQQYGVGAPGGTRSYANITVAVSPDEAEFLVFAQEKGKITVSLRNPEDVQTIDDLEPVNFDFMRANLAKYNQKRTARLKLPQKSGN